MSTEYDAALEIAGAVSALDDNERALAKLHDLPTLRQYFAAHAMEGCVEKMFSDELLDDLGGTQTVAEAIAKASFQIADAMLAEIAKKKEQSS